MVNTSKGFTLIELVVVIVILGILATVAAPKFIDLQENAKTATLRGAEAAMQSAIAMVYAKSVIKGNQNLTAGVDTVVDINGTDLAIKYGYPRADYTNIQGSWDDLIDLSDDAYTTTEFAGHFVIYLEDGEPTSLNDDCILDYKQANLATDPPEIKLNECL